MSFTRFCPRFGKDSLASSPQAEKEIVWSLGGSADAKPSHFLMRYEVTSSVTAELEAVLLTNDWARHTVTQVTMG